MFPSVPPSLIPSMSANDISNAAMLLISLGAIEALLLLCLSLAASLRYSGLLALERGVVSVQPIILSTISASPVRNTASRSSTHSASLSQTAPGFSRAPHGGIFGFFGFVLSFFFFSLPIAKRFSIL